MLAAMAALLPRPSWAACIDPAPGLVAWWPGEGNADDIFGLHHGSLINGATTAPGLVGQAFSLDGVDDFVAAPHHTALNVGTGDFTVNLWVKFASTTGEQVLVEKYVEKFGSGSTGWTFTKRSWNALQLATPAGSANTDTLTLPIETWIHFAARRSGNSLTIFMNGTLVGSGSASGSLHSNSSLKIGHRGDPIDTPGSNDTRGFYLNGLIDEVQLHTVSLTNAEIQSIAAAGADGQCEPPIICGNGLQQLGEECDDGNSIPGDGCENDCTLSCGNGMLTGSEECDDGNLIDGDGCDSNCTLTGCGNGIATSGEACDDGNPTNGDGCDSNCTFTGCGNGIVSAGESCDDGNLDDGDGCDSDCGYTQVSETLPPGGGTVSTGSQATPQFPTQVTLETNAGGTVTINSASGVTQLNGVQVIGVSFQIESPPTSVQDPMTIRFTIDASVIPLGAGTAQLEMVRNHIPVNDCTAPVAAVPDPCLASLTGVAGGDIEFVVRSSRASLWQVAVRGLSKQEQKCVNAMNKAGVKVARAQGKAVGACLKRASLGRENDAQGCLTADVDGKVAKKTASTTAAGSKTCQTPPVFAYAGASEVNTAGEFAPVNLVADLFGGNLDSAVIAASDKSGARCQAAVLGATQKLFDTKAKQFVKCKKDVLSGKTTLAVTPKQLAECFAAVASDTNDKTAKTLTKLDKALRQTCAATDLPTALPGQCPGGAGTLVCLDRRTNCRLCEMFDAMDALSADCDAIDDRQNNGSCP